MEQEKQTQPKAIVQAQGSYGIKSWDEKTWDGKNWNEEPDLKQKLTHAKVVFTFEGDFEGEVNVQMLMAYHNDSATFIGFQQMIGRLGNRTGSFVIQVNGVFENGAASSTWKIVPGSGTGDLNGIQGKGQTVAHHGDKQPYTFEYSFE